MSDSPNMSFEILVLDLARHSSKSDSIICDPVAIAPGTDSITIVEYTLLPPL